MAKLVLPRENLFRAVYATPDGHHLAIRATGDDAPEGDGRTLEVQWYLHDRWTEIDSWFEGNFMERIAPGAASKTIRENRANMRILLQHGRDPQLGDKPIAPIDFLEENDLGGFGGGELFEGLDPLVVAGLRAGVYGASFRFRVMREEINEEPEPSEFNPKGLPERTIKEMAVQEFGPVTWGAYAEASAGVRSITDEMYFGALRGMPADRLREVAQFWRTLDTHLTPGADAPEVGAEAPEADRDDSTELDAPSEAAVQQDTAEERREENPEAPAPEATPKVRDFLHEATVNRPSWYLS